MRGLAVFLILLLSITALATQTTGFYVNSSENGLEMQIEMVNKTQYPVVIPTETPFNLTAEIVNQTSSPILHPKKVITVIPIGTPSKQFQATLQIQNKTIPTKPYFPLKPIKICTIRDPSELSEKLNLNIPPDVMQISTPTTVVVYPKKVIKITDVEQEQEVSVENPTISEESKKPELRITYKLDIDKKNKELLLISSIENVGTGVAKNVKMIIEMPRELRVLSVDKAEYRILGNAVVIEPQIVELKPGESYETTIRFKLEPKYIEEGKDIQIPLKVGFTDEQGNWYWIVIILEIVWAIIQILLKYGLIPGFEVASGIIAGILALVLRKRGLSRRGEQK